MEPNKKMLLTGLALFLMVFLIMLNLNCAPSSVHNAPQVTPKDEGISLSEASDKLTERLTRSATAERKKSVAIVDFQNLDGSRSLFGKLLAEKLISKVSESSNLKVVERELLNKVWEEQELNLTDTIDESTARRIGKILGVEILLTGTITDLGESVDLNARMISTETGEVFAAASVCVAKDQKIKNLMAKTISESREIVEHSSEEKYTKVSLDIGIYYEDEQGRLQYITEGSFLYSEDAYALYVRPDRDCYLYIYQIDSLNRAYKLFPNEAYNTRGNPLKAKEDYWIPNTKQCFVLDEMRGKERLYIFASLSKVAGLERASTLQQEDFDQVLKTMGVAGLKDKQNPYQVKPPNSTQVTEVKKKLQAEGAFVYETWFWHR